MANKNVDQIPTKSFVRYAEQNAAKLRLHVGIDLISPVSIESVIRKYELCVINLSDIVIMQPDGEQKRSTLDVRKFSGSASTTSGGNVVLILNDCMTDARRNVTIIEEVAHIYYNHEPSSIIHDDSGAIYRTHDPLAEQEAYWTAAAFLLPSAVVAKTIYSGYSISSVAILYGVSVELFEFRIKTCNLWRVYKQSSSIV